MMLHNVLTAKYAEPPPSTAMVLLIDATIEGERDEFYFVCRPEDTHGLNPDVTAWLISNPEFPIAPFAPPVAPDPLDAHLTKRQIVRAMVINASITDPDAFIETAIDAIPDPTERALARADWRYAPYYVRTHALFSDPDLIAASGMSSAQIDALWVLGAAQPA